LVADAAAEPFLPCDGEDGVRVEVPTARLPDDVLDRVHQPPLTFGNFSGILTLQ
jgi:hypothetical protein